MIIAKRTLGNSIFVLKLVEIDGKVDFMVMGPNWCSGQLRAKYGWSLDAIRIYFLTADLKNDALAAWEEHGERLTQA